MARDGIKEELQPGFIQRVVQGMRYAVTGQKVEWFGPGRPQQPQAPEEVKGRQFQYPVGYNLTGRPREGEPINFETLRALADSHDLTRLAIETRKDQIVKLEWNILPKQKSGEVKARKPDERCLELEKFFERPDRIHSWNSWLRMVMEDLFVIDAPTLFARKAMDGSLYALEPVDGATIKLLLDEDGRQPDPPLPAYQQILHGVVAVEYSSDELIYIPRNPRSNKIYGFSPVEQIIFMINVALRRQASVMNYYTEGNVPEALIGVPETWTMDQISEFQKYWDSILEGDLALRRHAKFVPGNMQYQPTRDTFLKDEYDEWIARVVMYCFSLPPLPFVREMNRATAMTSHDAAIDEGLAPLMEWVKEIIDRVIETYFGYNDLEFVWNNKRELDPATQSAVNTNYVRAGIKSIDEARIEAGMDPQGIPLIVFGVGPLGFMYADDLKRPEVRAATLQGILTPPMGAGQPIIGPDGRPVIGPNGQPVMAPPRGMASAEGIQGDPMGGVSPQLLQQLGITPDQLEMPKLEQPHLDPVVLTALQRKPGPPTGEVPPDQDPVVQEALRRKRNPSLVGY